MTAERVLILYEGAAPVARETHELVRVIERETGVDLLGVRVTAIPATEATEIQAQLLVGRLEGEGQVAPGAAARTTTYTAEAAGGRRLVAAVWAVERNPWVRRAVRARLAKDARHPVSRRPGWARLATEPALGFVASADDGAGRRFPDVHIVVSLLSDTSRWRVRDLLPGGYRRWAGEVFRLAGVHPGAIDVAHWVVCARGRRRAVYLAYLPNDRHEPALPPRALLTREERRGSSESFS